MTSYTFLARQAFWLHGEPQTRRFRISIRARTYFQARERIWKRFGLEHQRARMGLLWLYAPEEHDHYKPVSQRITPDFSSVDDTGLSWG